MQQFLPRLFVMLQQEQQQRLKGRRLPCPHHLQPVISVHTNNVRMSIVSHAAAQQDDLKNLQLDSRGRHMNTSREKS
jgi:hypothetical protein